MTFLSWNKTNNDNSKHIQVEQYLEDATNVLFISFIEEEQDNATHMLDNATSDLIIEYYQEGYTKHSRILLPNSKAIFSWCNPNEKSRLITVRVIPAISSLKENTEDLIDYVAFAKELLLL